MKKDNLKELFGEHEIENSKEALRGGTNMTFHTLHTNGAHTMGDVGNCDTDTSHITDDSSGNDIPLYTSPRDY